MDRDPVIGDRHVRNLGRMLGHVTSPTLVVVAFDSLCNLKRAVLMGLLFGMTRLAMVATRLLHRFGAFGLVRVVARDPGQRVASLVAGAAVQLVEVSDELIYLPETLEEIERRVRDMPDGFTVADFRDGLAITRKYAVPLLEWMDARGITSREGEGRVVRRRRPSPSGVLSSMRAFPASSVSRR